MGVGSCIDSADVPVPLAEQWSASAWIPTTPPSPAGATQSVLSSVACPSGSAGTAVGYYDNGFGTRLTLSEQWNRMGWTVMPTPNPAGAAGSVLSGVSCTAAGHGVKLVHGRRIPGHRGVPSSPGGRW